MLLVHRSHLGAIKSAPDYMWVENTPITYWRYKYLKGQKGTLEDMNNMSDEVKVVFLLICSKIKKIRIVKNVSFIFF